jgi:glycosyltransferase involved in cell wall biosynthesis
MIGFIIIGKNEGHRLVDCIRSIKKSMGDHDPGDYEIIYVDSGSTDNSVELVRQQQGNISVFRVTGKASPAIGRNIGASESSAEIYCFVDGDMELVPDFLPKVIGDDGHLIYPFVSGQFENIYYDQDGQRTGSELYVKSILEGDRYQVTTGGLFLIEKSLWDSIGGMDVRFTTGEDLDLGLRLARKGHMLLRKKDLFALHHTRHYKSKFRMWQDLIAGKTLYARGLLYRKHILLMNRHILKRMVKSDPTFLLLIGSGLLTLLTKQPFILLVYPAGILVALLFFRKVGSIPEFFSRLCYQIVRDLLTGITLLFFHPRKAELQYETVEKPHSG